MLSNKNLQSAFRALRKCIGATCEVLRPLLMVFGAICIAALTFAVMVGVAMIVAPFKHRD